MGNRLLIILPILFLLPAIVGFWLYRAGASRRALYICACCSILMPIGFLFLFAALAYRTLAQP
jgi:hypothetical protein